MERASEQQRTSPPGIGRAYAVRRRARRNSVVFLGGEGVHVEARAGVAYGERKLSIMVCRIHRHRPSAEKDEQCDYHRHDDRKRDGYRRSSDHLSRFSEHRVQVARSFRHVPTRSGSRLSPNPLLLWVSSLSPPTGVRLGPSLRRFPDLPEGRGGFLRGFGPAAFAEGLSGGSRHRARSSPTRRPVALAQDALDSGGELLKVAGVKVSPHCTTRGPGTFGCLEQPRAPLTACVLARIRPLEPQPSFWLPHCPELMNGSQGMVHVPRTIIYNGTASAGLLKTGHLSVTKFRSLRLLTGTWQRWDWSLRGTSASEAEGPVSNPFSCSKESIKRPTGCFSV